MANVTIWKKLKNKLLLLYLWIVKFHKQNTWHAPYKINKFVLTCRQCLFYWSLLFAYLDVEGSPLDSNLNIIQSATKMAWNHMIQ